METKSGTSIVFSTCNDVELSNIIENKDKKFTEEEIKFANFEINFRYQLKTDVKNYSDEQLFNISNDEKNEEKYSPYEIELVYQEICDRKITQIEKTNHTYSFLNFCAGFLSFSALFILCFTISVYFGLIFKTETSFFSSLLVLVVGSSIAGINYVCSKGILLLIDIKDLLKNK